MHQTDDGTLFVDVAAHVGDAGHHRTPSRLAKFLGRYSEDIAHFPSALISQTDDGRQRLMPPAYGGGNIKKQLKNTFTDDT